MKVLILAGGLGTRLSEETDLKPKPMVEVGGKPIIWHIMKQYSHHGYNDFVILLGYKGYVIKEYFANYLLHTSDCTINLRGNDIELHGSCEEPWKITLIDTGQETMTGGRVKRAREHIGDEPFMLTYGDGLSDVNITDLVAFHESHEGIMSLTAVQPTGRFGTLEIEKDNRVSQFIEKPIGDNGWINGGYFVCDPEILDYIDDDSTVLERKPMEALSNEGRLFSFHHQGFWQCMDTLRDKQFLAKLWEAGNADWATWDQNS